MGKKDRTIEQPGMKIYLAGAGLANAPIIFLATILPSMGLGIKAVTAISFLAIFAGAVIAGFMVAGKVLSRYVTVGGMTGLFGFLFYIVFVLIFVQILTGDFWTAMVFVMGGCIGGMIRRKRRESLLKEIAVP